MDENRSKFFILLFLLITRTMIITDIYSVKMTRTSCIISRSLATHFYGIRSAAWSQYYF